MAEDLYDCAESVLDGIKHVELKEADTDAVWAADGYDPEQATFLHTNGKSEIFIDGYWPLQVDPDKRLRSFENLASKFLLPRSVFEHWSPRVKASKLSCPELVFLEQDVERFSDCGHVKRVSGVSVRGHGSLRGRGCRASRWRSVADRLQCR
ncbi:hypothetical protein, partial [Palleronia abyssalis]|uniref:hypothetical protein n=1 Tax=Palleronia abyssalis TaxID=1501240 RepID=UPI001C630931